MGLAPYGKPLFKEKLKKMVNLKDKGLFELDLKYFTHQSQNMNFEWKDGAPKFDMLFNEERVSELIGLPARKPSESLESVHSDIAASVQRVYEEVFFHILNEVYDEYKSDNLALSGGCAMNSVANGKIYKNTKFKKIYIPPAAGDAGGSVGAAYEVIKNKNLTRK